MNWNHKTFKSIFFSAVMLSLMVYIGCKGEITEIQPEFEPEIQEDVPDANIGGDYSYVAPDINADDGDVSNPASRDFSENGSRGDTEESRAQMAAISEEINNAFNDTQKAFWENQDQASISAGLESGDANFEAFLDDALQSFENSPELANFLPTVEGASGGRRSSRIAMGAYTSNNTSSKPAKDSGSQYRTADTNPTCVAVWVEWGDSVRAEYQADRDVALQDIEDALGSAQASLDDDFTTTSAQFETNYSNKKITFINEWSGARANILAAINAGDLTQEIGDLVLIFNDIILAINLQKSFINYQNALIFLQSDYDVALADLTAQANVSRSEVNTAYQDAVNALQLILDEKTAACHDQGSN